MENLRQRLIVIGALVVMVIATGNVLAVQIGITSWVVIVPSIVLGVYMSSRDLMAAMMLILGLYLLELLCNLLGLTPSSSILAASSIGLYAGVGLILMLFGEQPIVLFDETGRI